MNIEAIATTSSSITREQQWALGEGSIDFSSFDDCCFSDDPHDNNDNDKDLVQKPGQLMNDCSHADTISTAGLSGSWGEFSLGLSGLKLHDDDDDNDSDDNGSQSSLTLDDLKSFFVEDQVGIFNPERDDTPEAVRRQSQLAFQARRESMKHDLPPKVETDFKGDSQNSFTLDDLALDFEQEEQQQEEADNHDSSEEEEGSLGCLRVSPKQERRTSRRCSSTRKEDSALQGILRNGPCNTRRSSSLTMLLMEDSSLFQLDGDDDDNDDSRASSNSNDDWAMMMNGSLDVDAALDLQVLQERHVQFSTVVVHEHAQVLGDNPSVSEGAPLMLDWNAHASTTYPSLDDYEQQRSTATSFPVRKLDAEERMWRLLDAGVPLSAIQQAERQASKTRAEREATRQTILLGGVKPVFYKYIQNTSQRVRQPLPRRRKSPVRN